MLFPIEMDSKLPASGASQYNHMDVEKLFGVYEGVIPQQRKLGVFSHSKGSGAGRSNQNLPVPRFPGRVLQVPRFQGTGSKFPSSKDPVPREPGSQEQVFKQGS